MYKILFLHGLESEQGGDKIDFLSSKAIVHAPKIDYTEKGIYQKLISTVIKVDPDIIIGSSAGGYMGYILGAMFKKQTLLFNPALHSRTFEIDGYINCDIHPKSPIIVLGEQDTIIDPKKTISYLNNSNVKGGIVEMVEMGHRTDLETFKNMYNKYFE